MTDPKPAVDLTPYLGKVMNLEHEGHLICRGLITKVHRDGWVTIKETATGRADEWPVGEVFELVEC